VDPDPHVPGPGFPGDVDEFVRLAGEGEAYFGRDVLRGLVAGLREAASRPRDRWWWGPGVLGCAMWMDDPELIQVLGQMANVCIVVTKQRGKDLEREKVKPLRELAESSGLAQAAYYELGEYAPRDGNGPLIVGPGTPNWTEETEIGAVREVGFRKVGGRMVPIVHAKMALLGRMGWTDEGPMGGVGDEIFFIPERLWIGSANFTESSRSALEMGLWTDDSNLMAGARRFLLGLVALSEPLGTGPDTLDPELLPVEWDHAAMAEYLGELREDGYPHELRDDDEDW
jgi:hypothetical protein